MPELRVYRVEIHRRDTQVGLAVVAAHGRKQAALLVSLYVKAEFSITHADFCYKVRVLEDLDLLEPTEGVLSCFLASNWRHQWPEPSVN